MAEDIGAVLQQRKGPLPVWGWAIAGVAGIGFLWYFVHRRNAGSSTSSSTVTGGSTLTPSTQQAGGGAGYSGGVDLSSLTGAISALTQSQQTQQAQLLSAIQGEQQTTAAAIAGAQNANNQLLSSLGQMIQGLTGSGTHASPVTSPPGSPANPAGTPPVTSPSSPVPIGGGASGGNPFAGSSGVIISVDYGGGNHQVIQIADYLNMLRNGVGQAGNVTYYPMGWSGGPTGSASSGFRPVTVPNGVPTPVGWTSSAPA